MVEKAKIEILTGPGGPIEVLFNPTEYTHSKSTNWNGKQFLGTQEDDFTVILIFDSYEIREDVRKDHFDTRFLRLVPGTDRILQLTQATIFGQKTLQPPVCKFSWGGFEYIGIVKQVQQNFILFLETGIPVRAKVTVTFQSILMEEIQKIIAMGLMACRKSHVIRENDRLDLIAADKLKDPSLWPKIAKANGIEDPLDFPHKKIGQVLIIPDL
jgi:hypothetical protein